MHIIITGILGNFKIFTSSATAHYVRTCSSYCFLKYVCKFITILEILYPKKEVTL